MLAMPPFTHGILMIVSIMVAQLRESRDSVTIPGGTKLVHVQTQSRFLCNAGSVPAMNMNNNYYNINVFNNNRIQLFNVLI